MNRPCLQAGYDAERFSGYSAAATKANAVAVMTLFWVEPGGKNLMYVAPKMMDVERQKMKK